MHLHPYFKNKGYKKGDFENAENYFERCECPSPRFIKTGCGFVLKKLRNIQINSPYLKNLKLGSTEYYGNLANSRFSED